MEDRRPSTSNQNQKISHLTYTCNEDKFPGFVLRGLDFKRELEELKKELQEENIHFLR